MPRFYHWPSLLWTHPRRDPEAWECMARVPTATSMPTAASWPWHLLMAPTTMCVSASSLCNQKAPTASPYSQVYAHQCWPPVLPCLSTWRCNRGPQNLLQPPWTPHSAHQGTAVEIMDPRSLNQEDIMPHCHHWQSLELGSTRCNNSSVTDKDN